MSASDPDPMASGVQLGMTSFALDGSYIPSKDAEAIAWEPGQAREMLPHS